MKSNQVSSNNIDYPQRYFAIYDFLSRLLTYIVLGSLLYLYVRSKPLDLYGNIEKLLPIYILLFVGSIQTLFNLTMLFIPRVTLEKEIFRYKKSPFAPIVVIHYQDIESYYLTRPNLLTCSNLSLHCYSANSIPIRLEIPLSGIRHKERLIADLTHQLDDALNERSTKPSKYSPISIRGNLSNDFLNRKFFILLLKPFSPSIQLENDHFIYRKNFFTPKRVIHYKDLSSYRLTDGALYIHHYSADATPKQLKIGLLIIDWTNREREKASLEKLLQQLACELYQVEAEEFWERLAKTDQQTKEVQEKVLKSLKKRITVWASSFGLFIFITIFSILYLT